MAAVIEELSRVGYSPEEFAGLFGKTRYWTYEQMKAGRVKSVTVGHSRIIPASEAARILEDAS